MLKTSAFPKINGYFCGFQHTSKAAEIESCSKWPAKKSRAWWKGP